MYDVVMWKLMVYKLFFAQLVHLRHV